MSQYLMDQFRAEFWTTAGAMTFATVGLRSVREQLPAVDVEENPDPMIFVGSDPPDSPQALVDASWRLSTLDEALEPGGWLQVWMSDAWISLVFARWENYYRGEFASSFGVRTSEVRCDVMGDVRRLRNDILHHRGIATSSNAGRCLVLTTVTVGQRIALNKDDIRHLQHALQVSSASTD